MAFFHQGGHGGPPPLSLMNRWFTRFLHGVDNGVEKDPRAWIVREGDPPNKPTPYADYPNPDAAPVTLHPLAGGAAVGALVTAKQDGQKTEKLVDDVSIAGAQLAQAGKSEHRLLYATPELKEPVHVSGTPKLTIRLAASKPAANLAVWLVTLPWAAPEGGARRGRRGGGGVEHVITRGWADPQNSRSLRESAPLEPGRFYELTFDLEPDDQIIPAGQRIGLMIFSSDRDFTLWPAPGTELTVDLDKTALQLPVVGGAAAFARAVGLDSR
jgi:X-Pro dipeptidyl-peptidase